MSDSIFDLVSDSEESVADEISERASNARNGLNIGLDKKPEFVMASNVENLNNRINSGAAGQYSPLYGKVVIKDNSIKLAKEIGAHELEHARQAFRYAGFNEIVEGLHEILGEAGLIHVRNNDDIPEEAPNEFSNIRETELLSDLRDLGYSPDSLAKLISRNPELSDHFKETSEDFPDNAKSAGRNIAKLAQSIDIDVEVDTENKHGTDYSDERLNYLMNTIEEIESNAPEKGFLRTSKELIEGEKEGFAHFLSAYIENDTYEAGGQFERSVEKLSDSDFYDDVIEELGITVGERAAERVLELCEVYDNLVEHGDMSEHEAVEYIMDRVQERKVEYAARQMEDYDSIEDIEEALSV